MAGTAGAREEVEVECECEGERDEWVEWIEDDEDLAPGVGVGDGRYCCCCCWEEKDDELEGTGGVEEDLDGSCKFAPDGLRRPKLGCCCENPPSTEYGALVVHALNGWGEGRGRTVPPGETPPPPPGPAEEEPAFVPPLLPGVLALGLLPLPPWLADGGTE